MSEELSDFFKLISEDKKKKKEDFNEMVGDLGLDSLFQDIAAEKRRIKEEKENEEKKQQEQFNKLVGDIDIDSLLDDLFKAKVETKVELVQEIKEDVVEEIEEEVIEEVVEEVIWEEEVVEEEFKKEPSLVEKSLGLLSEPSEDLGVDKNFATLDDLQNHYRKFLNRIQQQLSTLGGGGENNDDGFEYISDKNLESNPIALVADTWTQVTNDGTSSSTKRQHLPSGINRIYDTSTNKIKLDQLPTRGWAIFRFGVKVEPNVDNVTLKARIAWTTGGSSPFTFYLTSPGALLNDGAGIEYEEQFTLPFYVGDEDTRTGSGILEVRADGTCSITDSAFMTIVG